MDETTPEYLTTHALKGDALVLDLNSRIAELRELPPGRDHRGVTLVKDGALNVVLVALRADGHLDVHAAPGPVAVQVLEGRVRLTVDDKDEVLSAGTLVALATEVQHSVVALEPAALLITIAFEPPVRGGTQAHEHTDEQLERATAFLKREVARLDPSVGALITSYRWHDDDVFDVQLTKGSAEVHLEVSCDRALERSTLEPVALEHDLEEAIREVGSRAGTP